MSGAVIWIVVLVVILVVLGVVVALLMNKRKTEQRRAHAAQLRTEAARAEERATEARQGVQMDQAVQEDRIREAQRVDPDDHRV